MIGSMIACPGLLSVVPDNYPVRGNNKFEVADWYKIKQILVKLGKTQFISQLI